MSHKSELLVGLYERTVSKLPHHTTLDVTDYGNHWNTSNKDFLIKTELFLISLDHFEKSHPANPEFVKSLLEPRRTLAQFEYSSHVAR